MNWISIKDALPTINQKVLVWDAKDQEISFNFLDKHHKFTYFTYSYGEIDECLDYEDGIITHWMPLPSKPDRE